MAEFSAKPLRILDSLYRFVGGTRGVSRVDLSSDITLVHDVSKQAEGAGLGPFFGRCEWSGTALCAGAATDTDAFDLPTEVATIFNIQEDEWDLYTIGISSQIITSDIGDLDTFTFGHGYALGTIGRAVSKYGSDKDIYESLVCFTGTDYKPFMRADENTSYSSAYWRPNQPVRVPDKGFIGWRMDSSAALQCAFRWELWAGPRGARPPGLP